MISRLPPTSRTVRLHDFGIRNRINAFFDPFSVLELSGFELRYIACTINLQATTQAYAVDKTEHLLQDRELALLW